MGSCRRCGRLILLATGLSLVAPLSAPAQVLNFRQYTAIEGLPQIQVLAIHQDRAGYFWFGTYGGLTRYDGAHFRTYTVEDGLNANSVMAITEDDAGQLVIGTGAGVCIRSEQGEGFSCQARVGGGGIADVLPAGAGTIWVATDGGVFVTANGSTHGFGVADGLPSALVHRLAKDDRGRIWAATGSGLARLEGDRFVEIAPESFHGHDVRVVMNTSAGLLVATDMGVFRDDGGGFTRLPLPVGVPGRLPVDATVDGAGTLWIATRGGAVRYDTAGKVQVLTRRNGLATNLLTRVTLDREGNVWFGTEYGASKLVPGPFVHLTEAEGLPSGFVRSITRAHDGRLWVGTRLGIAYLEDGRFNAVDMGKNLPDHRVYALAPLGPSGILAGTRNGLVRVGDGPPRRYETSDGLPANVVMSLLPDTLGRIWIGTGHGIAIWQDGRIEPVSQPGLDGVFALTMAFDDRGRLWVGKRSGGVAIYDGRTVTVLGNEQGLSTETVWSIARDRSGRMWVGTNGDGVYVFEPGSDRPARRLTVRQGLVNNFIWQVRPDRRGDIWLYTSQGLDRLRGDAITHYGRGDGLIDLEGSTNTTLEDADGTIWFGTGTGLVRYTPSLDVPRPLAPPVYIEELDEDGEALDLDRPRIQAGAGVVQVQFSAPSFRDESAIRFRYRLLGATDRWSEPTRDHTIRYASLPPGRYEFQVAAGDERGVDIAHPTTIAFTVLPAFWQTWLFRVAALLVLLAGAILAATAAARLRMRRLEADRRRLEQLVAEHTEALTDQNRRLEREVADRLAAEGALRKSEGRLREIVEHSTNLFFSHGPDHVLTYVSPQSRTFLDCEPEEALRRWTDFLTDNPANREGEEATERAFATGEKQPPYQLELRGAQGRKIWVEVNEAPVVRDGQTVAIVGSLTDVTQAKQAEEERERLELQLRQSQRMEAVGRLAGGVAHDFNNLLTAIVGNIDLLADGLGGDHPLADEVTEVRRAADRAAALVSQLLAFTRQQIVKPTTLDLNAVVGDAARMLRRMIGEDVELRLEVAPAPLLIEADRSQLDQILINLAVNARDAMPGGGALKLGTSVTQLSGRLPVDGGEHIPAGRYVVLTVSDTGAGMSPEVRSRVFEPFFTTKEVGKGTGLGLATVYGAVKQNGGYIRLESEVGKGSTFRIYLLPATSPATTEKECSPERAPSPTNGDHVVLVVEDENGVREFVCRTLRRYGYSILEACDGQAALEICRTRQEPIHLLLSDLIMPGMNGKVVADHIKALHTETRVLFMSGYTRDALGERGVISPSTQLLQKPFTPSDLVRRVAELLT